MSQTIDNLRGLRQPIDTSDRASCSAAGAIAALMHEEAGVLEALRLTLRWRRRVNTPAIRRYIAEIRELRFQLNTLWRSRFEYSEALRDGRPALEVLSSCESLTSLFSPNLFAMRQQETVRVHSFGSRDRRFHWRIAYAPKADRYFCAPLPLTTERLDGFVACDAWFAQNARAAAEWLQQQAT